MGLISFEENYRGGKKRGPVQEEGFRFSSIWTKEGKGVLESKS